MRRALSASGTRNQLRALTQRAADRRTYTYYTLLVVGYGWDETYARTGGSGPSNCSHLTGPGVRLRPGEDFGPEALIE